jgi:hypothetical protein
MIVLKVVWSSRLALTCANTAKFRVHLQVKRGQPTRRRPRTQLRRDVSAETPGTPALVLARNSCAAAPSPNVNTDPAET